MLIIAFSVQRNRTHESYPLTCALYFRSWCCNWISFLT